MLDTFVARPGIDSIAVVRSRMLALTSRAFGELYDMKVLVHTSRVRRPIYNVSCSKNDTVYIMLYTCVYIMYNEHVMLLNLMCSVC